MSHEYTVKPIKPNIYLVYKFEEGNCIPETSYTVTTYNSKLKCNCMSGRYRRYCKHTDMVKEYRKLERSLANNPLAAMTMITFRK